MRNWNFLFISLLLIKYFFLLYCTYEELKHTRWCHCLKIKKCCTVPMRNWNEGTFNLNCNNLTLYCTYEELKLITNGNNFLFAHSCTVPMRNWTQICLMRNHNSKGDSHMYVILTYDVVAKRVSKVMKTWRKYMVHVLLQIYSNPLLLIGLFLH